jgi:hypothetical protein
MLRIPHCVDSPIADGGEVVNQPYTPAHVLLSRNIFQLLVLIFIRGESSLGYTVCNFG